MKPEPKNLDSIEQLADRYADELSAQFRTLNLFVQHAGEVGRAHEVFLRGVLGRFLPEKLRCGSGFIASADHVTRQQDIIVSTDTPFRSFSRSATAWWWMLRPSPQASK